MQFIGKRIEPPEGVEPKLGDKVVYETTFDDGTKGTLTLYIDEFDLMCKTTYETDRK